MPRQIIDTESSRPAYVRRRVTTFVVIGVVLAALVAVAWVIFRSHAG
jgi:hypothetical protein